jgi:alpha,alpha-trehalase
LYESDDSHANEIAEKLAKKWLQSNLKSYQKDGVMYEKYDAEKPGQPAGGGEYEVQTGFGWSNGENLVLIDTFYT